MSGKFADKLKNAQDTRKKSIVDVSLYQKFSQLFVLMREKEALQEVRTGLHASSVIESEKSFCYRKQVLSMLFEQSQEKELPVNLLRTFAEGEAIHKKWQNMFQMCSKLKESKIKLIANEMRCYDERYDLYFTPDAVIEINDVLYIVEIKSMNSYMYGNALLKDNPHPSARKQLQLYMYLTGIPNGIILLENKNTQEFEVLSVEFNYPEVIPFIERLHKIMAFKKKYEKTEILPERFCESYTDKKAEHCVMKEACFRRRKNVQITSL